MKRGLLDGQRWPGKAAEWREDQRRQRAGHHGINAWKCEICGRLTVAIDVDPGVTPMFLGCRRTDGCKGSAVSSGYPAATPPPYVLDALAWEWTLPTVAEWKSLGSEERAWIDDGGLLLRPRSDRPSAYSREAQT